MEIDAPPDLPPALLPLTVQYRIILSYEVKRGVRVDLEEITFEKALTIASWLKQPTSQPATEIPRELADSYIKVTRRHGRNDNLQMFPDISEANVDLYLRWLGLEWLYRIEKGRVDLNKARQLVGLFTKREGKEKRRPVSFLDKKHTSICSFSEHAKRFSMFVSAINRYDLLQNELRREQQISTSPNLTLEGGNMPSVLRHVQKNDPAAWKRILNTLYELNPFVRTAGVSAVRTGKEFVEFKEGELKQVVESWETSDGTLRSLAMLLALETHPTQGTIVIEEPEQNLHPWAIRSLMNHIRQVIQERSVQVVLTTHSQQVLESVSPDEVCVVTRTENQGSKISSLRQLIPDHTIEMGEIGRLWVKGLLGGVPSCE